MADRSNSFLCSSMSHIHDYRPNQLQFNLDVPLTMKGMTVHKQRLDPVVIERDNNNIHASFKFQAISEDRMAMAIHMAKRDLKERSFYDNEARQPSQPTKRQSTSVIPSRMTKPSSNKGLRKKKINNEKIVENYPIRSPPRRDSNQLPVTTNSPPTRDTDTYPYHKGRNDVQTTDEIERLQLEMEGFLTQMIHIEELALHDSSQVVSRRASCQRRESGYLDNELEDRRLITRAEEYAARSARTLYTLRHQMEQLQQDLTQHSDKQAKKSDVFAKLKAAHRCAVRVIQTFVSNLPYQDLKNGPPSSYRELSLLIRQLTELNTYVKQGDVSSVQKRLISMLDRVDDLHAEWKRRRPSTARKSIAERKGSASNKSTLDRQAVLRQGLSTIVNEQKMAAERSRRSSDQQPGRNSRSTERRSWIAERTHMLTKQQSMPDQEPSWMSERTNLQTERQSRPVEQPSWMTERSARSTGESDWSVDNWVKGRQSDLSTDEPTDVDRRRYSQPDHEIGAKPSVSWDVMLEYAPSKQKEGKPKVVPAKKSKPKPMLKKKRTQKTTSSTVRRKGPQTSKNSPRAEVKRRPNSQSPRGRSQSLSPDRTGSRKPWKPPGSPTQSSSSVAHRSRSFSPQMSFISEDVDKDYVKITSRDPKSPRSKPKPSRSTGRTVSRTSRQLGRSKEGVPPLNNHSFVSSVVEEAKKRIQPYLRHRSSSSDEDNLTHSMGTALTKQVLNDILTDTVEDLCALEKRDTIHQQANQLRHSASQETMIQRLEQMEIERMEIRMRWSTLTYEEPKPVSTYLSTNEVLSDRPRTPPAFEISRVLTSHPNRQYPSQEIDQYSRPVPYEEAKPAPRYLAASERMASRRAPAGIEVSRMVRSHPQQQNMTSPLLSRVEGITFTKASKRPAWKEVYHQEQSDQPVLTIADPHGSRSTLCLPQGVASNILEHRDEYETYLKKLSHHPQGIFQPWTLVEQLSDDIVNECLAEIALELDDMNDDIAHDMYQSEFMEFKGQTDFQPDYIPSDENLPSTNSTQFRPLPALSSSTLGGVSSDVGCAIVDRHMSPSILKAAEIDFIEEMGGSLDADERFKSKVVKGDKYFTEVDRTGTGSGLKYLKEVDRSGREIGDKYLHGRDRTGREIGDKYLHGRDRTGTEIGDKYLHGRDRTGTETGDKYLKDIDRTGTEIGDKHLKDMDRTGTESDEWQTDDESDDDILMSL